TISIFISCSRSFAIVSVACFGGGVGCCAAAWVAEISTLPIRKTLTDRHCRHGVFIFWFIEAGRDYPVIDDLGAPARVGDSPNFSMRQGTSGTKRCLTRS